MISSIQTIIITMILIALNIITLLIVLKSLSFSFIASKFCGKDRERNHTNKSNRRFLSAVWLLSIYMYLQQPPFYGVVLHFRRKQILDSLNAIILAS